MGTYQTYEKYKDSGIEWLENIPDTWEVEKIKYLVSKVGSGITPKGGAEVYQLEGIPLLRSQNIYFDGLKLEDVAYISENIHQEMSNSRVLDGDVLLNITGGSIGRCFYIDEKLGEANANQHVCIIRPQKKLSTLFLYFFLRSSLGQTQIDVEQTGSGREGLNFEALKNFVIAIPELEEQEAIARFLDYKTEQIDQLIAKKEALLEKLDEKRTTLITHAVTKGLDPTVPMKDSGIEWLGDIPEHWHPIKIRYCSEFITSGSRGWSQFFSDNGNIFLRIANVSRDGINLKLNDIKRVDLPSDIEGQRAEVLAGDIIVSITADLGSVAVIPNAFEKAYVSQHLALIRPNFKKIDSQWLAYQVFSDIGKKQLLSSGYGGTKVQLSLTDIKDVWIALPSKEEQNYLITSLKEKTSKINKQKAKILEAIEKLKEYRTALITNAVTGKIDVRSVFIPQEVA